MKIVTSTPTVNIFYHLYKKGSFNPMTIEQIIYLKNIRNFPVMSADKWLPNTLDRLFRDAFKIYNSKTQLATFLEIHLKCRPEVKQVVVGNKMITILLDHIMYHLPMPEKL